MAGFHETNGNGHFLCDFGFDADFIGRNRSNIYGYVSPTFVTSFEMAGSIPDRPGVSSFQSVEPCWNFTTLFFVVVAVVVFFHFTEIVEPGGGQSFSLKVVALFFSFFCNRCCICWNIDQKSFTGHI
ncbi:hypothetical protein CEXT_160671 [Caerostris extrusa]|uniref:Uncharacterized protein n=1 Tax=Caerostris extrusa TaxID=172846 RepID=A0AAV4MZP8_CAEEX|nr:hypothetical protein CEXT_160671 [Caerostris extrusa]